MTDLDLVSSFLDPIEKMVDEGTFLAILFTYFALSATFLLIYPILLGYHSRFIRYADSRVTKWSLDLIEDSSAVIRKMNKAELKSEIVQYRNRVKVIMLEFEVAKSLLRPKDTLKYYFGILSISLFFIILWKIFYYSSTKFPIKTFLAGTDFTLISWFSLCWWSSIFASIVIFMLRLSPVIKEQGRVFFGLKRKVIVVFFFFLVVISWQFTFFYFAYPAIAYFIATLMLLFLLLIENFWLNLDLNGNKLIHDIKAIKPRWL